MKLIFMGSPHFAIPALQKLIDSNHDIECVYTQPPRPAGRGKKHTPTAVQQLADEHWLEVRSPERLKGDALEQLLATPCDAIVVVAYGLLLPQEVLDHAPCINIHPSALPRWRGPAPLQHTLLNGDETTDVCIMKLDIGMDTGPVYLRQEYAVGVNETLGELHDRLADEGATLLLDVLTDFETKIATPQAEEGVTIAPKITKEMAAIDWKKPAADVHNHIRGMSPFPGACTQHGDMHLKILRSELADQKGIPGEVLAYDKDGLIVACDDAAVRILNLQRAGKKPMDIQDFVPGYEMKIGDILA